MIDTIYIEDEVRSHPKAQAICARFPQARLIACGRYGEVFNPKAQNFRLQKQNPALILAKKFGRLVLEVPAGYGLGGKRNFYFSHMLNCIYDCRYCFLQGMYQSAHYVLFVNYEDFERAIEERMNEFPNEEIYFFSGYDCDSLALESISKFAAHFLTFFGRHRRAWLELRTKSIQIQTLLGRYPIPNCIVAFSLTPAHVSRALEHSTPSLERRLEAMAKLGERGWKLGLRFDPLIYHEGYKQAYEDLFREVFREIDVKFLHSVSLGPFRLPKEGYERIWRLYPDEQLFAGPLHERNGMVSYGEKVEREMRQFVMAKLTGYVPKRVLFPCGF